MKKTIIAIFLLLFIPTAIAPEASCEPSFCVDADQVFDVDMFVVGDGCHSSLQILDTEDIDVLVAGHYQIYGVVDRGFPGQCQTHEDFFLDIAGQIGPETSDDADACAITTREDYLGDFNLVQGINSIEMHTAAQCPPDTLANSVELSKLCIYYDDNDVPEFGLLGGLAVLAAIAVFVIKKRR